MKHTKKSRQVIYLAIDGDAMPSAHWHRFRLAGFLTFRSLLGELVTQEYGSSSNGL